VRCVRVWSGGGTGVHVGCVLLCVLCGVPTHRNEMKLPVELTLRQTMTYYVNTLLLIFKILIANALLFGAILIVS